MTRDDARAGAALPAVRALDAERPARHALTVAQTDVLDAIVASWNKQRAAYGGRRAATRDYVIAALLEMAPSGELK